MSDKFFVFRCVCTIFTIILCGLDAGKQSLDDILAHSGYYKSGSPKSVKDKKNEPKVKVIKTNQKSNSKKDTVSTSSSSSPTPKGDGVDASKAKKPVHKPKNVLNVKVSCAKDGCNRYSCVDKGGKSYCCLNCTDGTHTKKCLPHLPIEGNDYFRRDELSSIAIKDLPNKLLPVPLGVHIPYSYLELALDTASIDYVNKNIDVFGTIHDVKGFQFDEIPIYIKQTTGLPKTRAVNTIRTRQLLKFSVALAALLSLQTAGAAGTRFSFTHSFTVPTPIANVTGAAIWRLSLPDARSIENSTNGYIDFGPMTYDFPSNIEVLLPCPVKIPMTLTYNKTRYTALDDCVSTSTRYSVDFSSTYTCDEFVDTFDDFKELLTDTSANCAMVTSTSLLSKIKRKLGHVKLKRPFHVATSSIGATALGLFQSEVTSFVGSEKTMGVVKVDGVHRGTFFCHNGRAYTAWHVVSYNDAIQLCMKDCIKVGDILRRGDDVAVINVKSGWCSNLKLPAGTTKAFAYGDNMKLSIMDVIMAQSGDDTTLTVSSGRWSKGMSGGPLVIDGRVVAVVTAMRGWFRQNIMAYALDGEPYKSYDRWEL